MPEILDFLNFGEVSTQLDSWKLFDRKGQTNEFAGIYVPNDKRDGFLVEGPYANLDVPRKDLEGMGKVLNEGKVSKFFRKMDGAQVTTGIILGPASWMLDRLYNEGSIAKAICTYFGMNSTPNFDGEAAVAVMSVSAGLFGTCILGSIGGEIFNRYYSLKLSKDAESYFYGKDAEKRLKGEFVFEKVKSGALKKEDFIRNWMV